jgi:hypothetical protein
MIGTADLRSDWDHLRRLQHGSSRRFLASLTASADRDPIPFVIWASALGLTPPLLGTARAVLMLSTAGDPQAEAVVRLVLAFRVFFIAYAILMALLATALIWEALLPSRTDQDIVGALPVRPAVLAASRLAAGFQVVLVMSLALGVPVSLLFGGVSAALPRIGSLPRVLMAHVITVTCAMSAVFFSMAAVRAAVAVVGGQRMAERLGSLLQFVTVLVFIESLLFLPALLSDLFSAVQRGADVAFWYKPPLWFGALYGWLAEGGPLDDRVWAALLLTFLPASVAIALTVIPARMVAERVQESLSADRASVVTTAVRYAVRLCSRRTSVRGMILFAAATLSRSRRHAAILASYAGLAVAMGVVELVTASFSNRFAIGAPRQDNLALPLVGVFFAVIGLRAAMARPADSAANWLFHIAPPHVRDCRRVARLVVYLFGVWPVLLLTLAGTAAVWAPAVVAQVVLMDAAAAALLVELALRDWRLVPCASLHESGTEGVKSTWPLQMAGLYLFAFRGADVEMLALRSPDGVALVVGLLAAIVVIMRLLDVRNTIDSAVVLDTAPDSQLALLQLSDAEA